MYGNIILFWLNAILSIIIGLKISGILVKWNGNFVINKIIEIGRNSILFVCLNQLIICFVSYIITLMLWPKIVLRLLVLIVSIVALWCLNVLVNKYKINKIFGRF